MAVTDVRAWFSDSRTIRLDVTTDTAEPFLSLYRDGSLVDQTYGGAFIQRVDFGAMPLFQVFDYDEPHTPESNVGRVRLSWPAWSDAAAYSIEQRDGNDWEQVGGLYASGQGSYSWTSPPLADATVAEFRVVGVSPGGLSTPLAAVASTIIRTPDVPIVSTSVSVSGGVTPILTVTTLV